MKKILSNEHLLLFAEQEKFPFVEEKLKTLKGTEELGFQAVVKLLLVVSANL